MIYLKRIVLQNDTEKEQLESAIRKFSLKRHGHLDFKSAISNIGTDKYFLGAETKESLKFTRIKTSLEWLLPKVIICIPKDKNLNYYKIRLSLFSTILLSILSIGLLANVVSLISKTRYDGFFLSLLLCSIFLLVTLLEIRITTSKIKKSTQKQRLNTH